MQVRQAVHDFISALELTPAEREAASDQHKFLRDGLASRLKIEPDLYPFLTGSYARSTAIRPLKDIDLFCVLQRTPVLTPASSKPMDALATVRRALEDQYPGKTADPQNRSVNISFSTTGIAYDVVPAFLDEDNSEVFWIPDLQAKTWIRSNPRIHERLSVDANKAAGQELKPLTKAVKHWNRRQPEGERLRSFHIEVMIWDVLVAKPEDRLEGLIEIFEGLASRVLLDTRDPAALGPYINQGMTDAAKTAARTRLGRAASTLRAARELAQAGHTERAHHLLYGMFGDPYPEKGRQERPVVTGVSASLPSAPDGHGSRFG
ncbi:nucleotidyltransferase domain-containing protein [Corallococcus carmarthensis]|uniref:Nucleotidyltransferase n=1 Tax=Corallococcus carmarthensis TaxID=2316728 RepID=A0A3A8K4K3_9BACT|nr:nucleotidyltransferase [Corallococcus carmarthensis]RKH02099.1 nucleotidyltransferase [Corallococcus carmarthensis]